jgi:hypothetical protein
MTDRSKQGRRIAALLAERKVSSGVMLAVLSTALFVGLVGIAFYALWIVSVVVLALGLGYVVATTRQDRKEIIEQAQDEAEPIG